MLADWPEGTLFVGKLLPAFGPDEILQLHRILHGKTYSPDTLSKTISLAKQYLGPRQAGELTERAGTAAVNASRVPDLQIKKGTQLIEGKHNGLHGIDRIGLDPDGHPLIVEFTAGKNFKEAGDPVQMTADWVAERWNKLLANGASADALRDLGVPEKFLKPGAVSADVVRHEFVRKVVVPKDTRISNFATTGLDGTKDLITF